MRPDPTSGSVLVRTFARPAARSGALWGLIFGGYVAASASGYATTYPTVAARLRLTRTLGNGGFAALLGPGRHLETVAGFTAWRTMGVLTVVGAVWALLIATKHLRGEEDAGRWEILLSGPTTRGRLAAAALAGLATGLLSLWAVTAVVTVADGSSSNVNFPVLGSLELATSLIAGAVMFMAVGALTSQLAANRKQANGIGGAVISAAYLIRMMADSAPSLAWLRWASPLGWTEELHPLTGFRAIALLPIVALAAALITAALRIAGRRDLGASALPAHDTPTPHIALLRGPAGLDVRLNRGSIAGWLAAVAALGVVLGVVAQSAAGAISDSPSIVKAINRLGGHRIGAATYLGIAFLSAAAVVAFLAASQIAGTRSEESAGYLDHLLARPVSRGRWLGGRLAVAGTLLVAASVITAVASWLGAVTQRSDVSFGQLFDAGLNGAAPALFVLGAGTLLYGLWPRRSVVLTYGLVVWSLLVEMMASVVTTNRALLDTSVFAHITPAPAADPNWGSDAGLVGLGLLAAALGIVLFGRRDLVAE